MRSIPPSDPPRTRPAPLCARRLVILVGLVATLGAGAGTGAATPDGPRGFLASRTDALYSAERRLMAAIDPLTARTLFETAAAEPRVAGTPAAGRAADWLVERLESWGWAVERRAYRVYLPHATEVEVWRQDATPLPLVGPAARHGGDDGPGRYPAAAGYSASGDVSGPVVYAHRGRPEDFDRLEASGVSVAGAVALIRYGDTFRGAKVRAAEEAGVAAVLLYSDPAEDGFLQGAVFPSGPYRPADGIERGSVKVEAPGDPTTPGFASLEDARRILPGAPGSGLPRIPVVALGYEAAAALLEPLAGPSTPAAWQGGLPFPYRLGGTPAVRARVRVALDDRPYKTVTNVLARRPGTRFPDQVVAAGAHYDSWTEGAVDNASGTVSLLLTARAVARLEQFGIRPARSLLLAFWDAEEWGLVGSTEYVEERAEALAAETVAYLNQDGVAGGPFFGAAASPSLARLLRDVALLVPDPERPQSSVYDEWLRRAREGGWTASMTPPGAGSDHAAFFGHLGVPAADFGFQGPEGVYHSGHDGREFMERFGDPDFARHVASARITALAAWRLADADLVPLDYGDYGRLLLEHVRDLPDHSEVRGERIRLEASARRFLALALRLQGQEGDALATGWAGPETLLARANRELLAVEGALTRPQGLPGRPWFRNVVYAPDRLDAYRVTVLPGIADALAAGDRAHLKAEIRDLANRLDRAGDRIAAAAVAIVPGGPLRVGGP